jgi:uncharacterized membrane protein
MNSILRVVADVLALCLAASAANDHFDLGWFGGGAKLLTSILMFATVLFLIVARRSWRSNK